VDFIFFLVAYAAAAKAVHWGFLKIWPNIRDMVVTDRWEGRATTVDDHRTWLDVGITAGAGGVLGFLAAIALEQLYVRIKQSQPVWPSWKHIIAMLVLTFIGVKLFAPIHDLLERLLQSRLLKHRAQHEPAMGDWRTGATVGAIVFTFLIIDESVKEVIDGALKGISQEFGLFEAIKA
jgi:hypothetical protein